MLKIWSMVSAIPWSLSTSNLLSQSSVSPNLLYFPQKQQQQAAANAEGGGQKKKKVTAAQLRVQKGAEPFFFDGVTNGSKLSPRQTFRSFP